MKLNHIGVGLLIFGAASCGDASEASDGAARRILQQAGINGGVACLIGCGDGEIVLELARESEFLILALDPDPVNVANTERQAADAGMLGGRVYVAQGTARQIPLADNYVDVLVLTAVGANDLDEEARREIMRVLSPVRGRALIGDQVLTKPALSGADDWTHRLHGPDNNPVSYDTAFQMPAMLQYLAMPMQTSFQGTTLVAGGRRIELSDWVTKKPDRNAVAGKLTARSLYNGQLLWQRDLPEGLEPDTPICVLDAERIYLAAGDSCRVSVIDAETGGNLPSLTLGDAELRVKWLGMEAGRLHALLGPPLPVRAPRSYMMGGPNRQIRMDQAAAGRTLVAWDLAAEKGVRSILPERPEGCCAQNAPDPFFGSEDHEVWRHEESTTIDYRTVALRGGRTYFYSEGARLACLAADGKLLWENRDDSWLGTLKRPDRIVNANYESTGTLIVGPSGQLRLSLPGLGNGLTFHADNGRLLWNDTIRGPKCFFVGDRYFSPQGILEAATGTPIGQSDTFGSGCGIVTWVPGLEKGLGHVALGVKSPCGVGAFAAGGTLVFSPSQCDCWPHLRGAAGFSSGGDLFRLVRENPEHPLVRVAQGEPNAPASGGAATGMAGRTPEARRTLAADGPEASAYGSLAPEARRTLAADGPEASAYGSLIPEASACGSLTPEASACGSVGDWPQYRGDLRRRGLALIPAGDDARVRWTLALEKPFPVPEGHDMHRAEWLDRPTPPVTADGLAVYAASDGSVRAVRIDDGQPAWTFWTGGPVLTSPAIAHGRAYVGSGDGWVYCLDAKSGGLIWKWQGAPVDRRVIIYGKLTNLWPITAMMVADDRVFGVAGQAMQNGSVTFALDAVTGKPDWTTWTEPAYDGRDFLHSDDQGFGPSGQLAMVGSRLWVRTYRGMPAVFDWMSGRRLPATDELVELQKANSWGFGVRISTSGQDMIVIDDGLVLQGGYPLLGNPDIRHDKTAARFIAYYVDEAGRVSRSPLPRTAIPGSQIAPSVDDHQILIVGGAGRSWRSENSTVGLSLWSLEGWRSEFEKAAAQPSVNDDDAADPAAPSAQRSAAATDLREGFCLALDMNQSLWHVPEADVNAVVLCRDAAVAVVGQKKRPVVRGYGMHPGFERWKLVAFDRITGEEVWHVDLPGEPVFNGLAPSAGGSWILVLRDGSLVSVQEP